MTVIEITELNQSEGVYSATVVNFDRHFLVKSDCLSENPWTVITGKSKSLVAIPKLYDTYRVNNLSIQSVICTSIAPRQRKDQPYFWDVACHYDWVCVNVAKSGSSSNFQNDPVDWLPTISGDFVKYQRPVYTDIFGNAIVNSAGDPYDPPAMIDDHRFQLRIGRYETTASANTSLTYMDAVNSDTFWGVDPGYAKIIGIAPEMKPIQNYIYWHMTYTIEFRADGWNLKPLDKGYYCLIDQNGDPSSTAEDPDCMSVPILDGAGNPVKVPQCLDGLGNPLDRGQSAQVYPPSHDAGDGYLPGDPEYDESAGYKVYKQMAFSGLNLPDPGLSFASGVL